MSEDYSFDQERKTGKSFGNFVVNLFTFILLIPVFIMLHRAVPNVDWPLHSDRILLLICAYLILQILLSIFKPLVVIGFFLLLGYLIYGSIWGEYGFRMAYTEYRGLIGTLTNEPMRAPLPVSGKEQFFYTYQFNEAIFADDSLVRSYAIGLTKQAFTKEADLYEPFRKEIQCLAVFKGIRDKWTYVYDPPNREYFAKPSESMKLMAGDCDDYSILMAATLERIGGEVRLIETNGHIYPELLIGPRRDFEMFIFLIQTKLFPESLKEKFYYHIDNVGNYWMNLDYTEKYPGGQFLDKEVIAIYYPEQP